MWFAACFNKLLSAGRLARYAAPLFLVLSGELGAPDNQMTREGLRISIDDPAVASAWKVLRTVNCERCHGKDYEGLAAPSIVDYVRTQGREPFVRAVLDGNAVRGMPAYRGNPLVDANIEGIYRYFAGRADGSIGKEARPAMRGQVQR